MSAVSSTWKDWPALSGLPPRLPAVLRGEQAVWGRAPGAASGSRWIAASPGFAGKAGGLEGPLDLGLEDRPRKLLLWRSAGGLHHAVHGYPGRLPDAAGRRTLEKQVLEWPRPAELPAALGALILLGRAATLTDALWWGRTPDSGAFARDFHIALPEDPVGIPVDELDLRMTIQAGCQALAQTVAPAALGALYARLLAGARGIALAGLAEPLPPEALAVLLLPLPRERADRLSLAGWWPSSRAPDAGLARTWDLILGGDDPAELLALAGPAPDAAQTAEGARLAEALLAADPGRLASRAPARSVQTPPTGSARRIVLWGLAAAGKTAYLAQLYLQLEHAAESAWRVLPEPDSVETFARLRARLQTANRFPAPTPVGSAQPIRCRLIHRETGAEAVIEMEDRSGEDYRAHHAEAQAQLDAADGLVLLFDPLLDVHLQRDAFKDTLDRLSAGSPRIAGRDPRPVAFCLAKSDAFIRTAEDERLALEAPDDFVRQRVEADILQSLDHHFARCRRFPVSAAGVWTEHGAVESAVFLDEALDWRLSSHGRPLHLLEPLVWIMDALAP